MQMIISFDGREVLVKNPSDKLCDEALAKARVNNRLYLQRSVNCDEILVFPGKHGGIITEMYILRTSISAVRFVSPTSSVKG